MTAVIATMGLSFAIVLLAVLGMAAGTVAGRAPIKGSCGGVGGRGCELCREPCDAREEGTGDGRCR